MTDLVGSPDILMVWPRGNPEPPQRVPAGYSVAPLPPADDEAWIRIHRMAVPSFPTDKLESWLARYRELALPDAILVATDEASGERVATAGAIAHSKDGMFPGGGQLAWVATVPAHRGRGLARALSARSTARLMRDGYRRIFLSTGDDLTAAIGLYLDLGYLPCLYASDQPGRWRRICAAIGARYEPRRWMTVEEYNDDLGS